MGTTSFDSEHPGYCLAQDTFYVGTLKGVGRVYQQTVIDTYSKVGTIRDFVRGAIGWKGKDHRDGNREGRTGSVAGRA